MYGPMFWYYRGIRERILAPQSFVRTENLKVRRRVYLNLGVPTIERWDFDMIAMLPGMS
jgi:hypothetical protein